MNEFAIAAGLMAVIHLVAGCQRPRMAVIVSGILWLLYAVYEYLVVTVGCDGPCNIRVDLVFIIPILAFASYRAYQSYYAE